MMKLKRVRQAVIVLCALIVGVYAVNTAAIMLSAPVNQQNGDAGTVVATYGDVDVVSYEGLRSGGLQLLGWNAETIGYVNMFNEEQTIYIDSVPAETFQQQSSLYDHELAHIWQKRMVAEESGGYPSFANPVQSVRYFWNLFRLNNELAAVMPETNEEAFWLTAGLEAAADCYAQPSSSTEYDPVYYEGGYLLHGSCTAEQRRNAIKLITYDVWFTPLTETEVAELEEANITSVPNVDMEGVRGLTERAEALKDMIRQQADDAQKSLPN